MLFASGDCHFAPFLRQGDATTFYAVLTGGPTQFAVSIPTKEIQ
jgi:hypothetical protein